MADTTKTLPCKLTDKEILAKGDELAQKLTELDQVKKEKSEMMSDYTAKIKKIEKESLKLATDMTRKTEDREVKIIENPDFQNGIMETVRADTGERIAHRLLTPEERQGHLYQIDGAKKGKTATEAP